MEYEFLAEQARIFKVLGDKTRLTILKAVQHETTCVCDLVDFLEISQPAVSQHLSKLKEFQLVTEERRGKWKYYAANITEETQWVFDVLQHVEEVTLTTYCEDC